ncbi:hypothetical protein J624_0127 [Acinetobacter baumannii 1062314]|nr:hypothetical protein J624_0127 [Acinetobacter baumannii 1062314]
MAVFKTYGRLRPVINQAFCMPTLFKININNFLFLFSNT